MEAYLFDWVEPRAALAAFHCRRGLDRRVVLFRHARQRARKPARAADVERGVAGELWAVHGGGVYHSQKYLVGPVGEPLAEKLHWSKWEAYHLAVGHGPAGGRLLVRRQNLPGRQQVMALSPAGGDRNQRRRHRRRLDRIRCIVPRPARSDSRSPAIIFVLVSLAAWGLFQVLSARGAYLHVGAMMGYDHGANVFFHIIPGRKNGRANARGEEPDAEPGIVGKQRSVHNTYFTLPVLFIMISNHYPMTYSQRTRLAGVDFYHAGRGSDSPVFRYAPPRQRAAGPAAVAVVLLLAMIWYLSPRADGSAGAGQQAQIGAIIERALRFLPRKPRRPSRDLPKRRSAWSWKRRRRSSSMPSASPPRCKRVTCRSATSPA